MQQTPNKKSCEYPKRKVIEKYLKIVESIDKKVRRRNAVLERHFKLLLEPKPAQKNIEDKLVSILDKPLQLPPLFLASSLGFNKHSWSKSVEILLSEFNLEKKLKYPTMRNALLFEKLKTLVIRLCDKERRRR